MPSATYYRAQAKLLFFLALMTRDREIATRYALCGQEFLLRAKEMELSQAFPDSKIKPSDDTGTGRTPSVGPS